MKVSDVNFTLFLHLTEDIVKRRIQGTADPFGGRHNVHNVPFSILHFHLIHKPLLAADSQVGGPFTPLEMDEQCLFKNMMEISISAVQVDEIHFATLAVDYSL